MTGIRSRLGLAVATVWLPAVWLSAAQPAPNPPENPPSTQDATPPPEESDTRVVRGTEARPGSAPWQIEIFTTVPISDKALQDDNARSDTDPNKRFYKDWPDWERSHVCGGVLITPEWALTAAHCFVDSDGWMAPVAIRRVRLGNSSLLDATQMAVERIIVHGDYRNGDNNQHDIALIRIQPDAKTDASMAANAKPAVWPDLQIASGAPLKVTGWGYTAERDNKSGFRDAENPTKPLRKPAKLLEGGLNLLPAAACLKEPSYRPSFGKPAMGKGIICAGGTDQDACQGDSGGPLTYRGKLVGLVSYGRGCGIKGVPALYTRVSFYRDWINLGMRQSPPGVSSRCVVQSKAGKPTLSCTAAS